MTISPQTAKTVRAIADAYENWYEAVVAGDSLESAAALSNLKQTLTDCQTNCPACEFSMTTVQTRKPCHGKISTLYHCPKCQTTVEILTPTSK